MKRALGKFESAATITDDHFPWNLVGIVRLEGLPAADTLRQALDQLQARHPFLRVSLAGQPGRYYFETGDVPPIPLEVVSREDDGHWQEMVETALNSHINRSPGPLARGLFLTGPEGRGEIILAFHHAIVDGASVGNLFHELLSACAVIESGSPLPAAESLAPLPPVETHFPAAFQGAGLQWKSLRYAAGQMGDELSFQAGSRGGRKPPIHAQARGRILPLRIPEPVTSALVRRTRQARLTLNSALNAAMLLGVHKVLYHGEDALLRYMSMVDLRPYLDPPIPPHDMGCCISFLRFATPLTPGRGFWSLAGEINARIYAASQRGDKFLASIMSEQFLRMTFNLKRIRMSTTALSYTGPSALAESYGPMGVLAMHGFISNFGLGPEYSAHASLFKDEILWDILYLDTDLDRERAQAIAAEMLGTLELAGATSPEE